MINPAPTTRLGGQALKGRDSRELAFIAGRHLTWYRREHLLGRPNRSVRRLEDMFLAALRVANPRRPRSPDVEQRVQPIARSLQPLLDAAAVEKLQTLFQRFVEAGGRTNLTRWLAGAERTAVAAGALLAGDLFASKRMLELEAGLPMTRLNPREVARAEREMLVFFTSARCSSLRRRIGIAVTG